MNAIDNCYESKTNLQKYFSNVFLVPDLMTHKTDISDQSSSQNIQFSLLYHCFIMTKEISDTLYKYPYIPVNT